MPRDTASYLTPEARARVRIDEMLDAAGWAVQDVRGVNLAAARGVAVREFVLEPPHGRVDYLLFADRKAVGVIEAKKEGETLTGVAWQSSRYLDGLPDWVEPRAARRAGVRIRVDRDRDARSRTHSTPMREAGRCSGSIVRRRVAAVLREADSAASPTLRHRLAQLPDPRHDRAVAGPGDRDREPRAIAGVRTGRGR